MQAAAARNRVICRRDAAEQGVLPSPVIGTCQYFYDRLTCILISILVWNCQVRVLQLVLILNNASLAEGVDFKARLPGRLVRDRDDIQVVLLEEQAAINIVPVPRKFLLNDKLWHVEHDLWAELTDLEELDHWLRVASVLSVNQSLKVKV